MNEQPPRMNSSVAPDRPDRLIIQAAKQLLRDLKEKGVGMDLENLTEEQAADILRQAVVKRIKRQEWAEAAAGLAREFIAELHADAAREKRFVPAAPAAAPERAAPPDMRELHPLGPTGKKQYKIAMDAYRDLTKKTQDLATRLGGYVSPRGAATEHERSAPGIERAIYITDESEFGDENNPTVGDLRRLNTAVDDLIKEHEDLVTEDNRRKGKH